MAFFAAVFFSCSTGIHSKKTFRYFKKNLRAGMDYPELVSIFGNPAKDTGRGIHIYIYDLKDGSTIWIGYANSIQYAIHKDKDGVQLHNLISK